MGISISAHRTGHSGFELESCGKELSENAHLALSTLTFISLLAAGGFCFLGADWMKATAFAWCFLVFMIPMPEAMDNTLETWSMNASATAANIFFDIGGPPHLRLALFPAPKHDDPRGAGVQRHSFKLGSFYYQCARGSSFSGTTWKRLLLVCFVIPLGLVRNGFRVWVIGSLCVHFGPQMIDSPIHRQGGPVFFVLSLIPLFLLAAWLRRHEQTATERAVLPAGESKLGSPGIRDC